MTQRVTARQFREAKGAEDWRVLVDGANAFYPTSSFAESARFVSAIANVKGAEDHKPDVDVRRDGVSVRLLTVTPDFYGCSTVDLELARQISDVGA